MDVKLLTYHINRGWVPYWRNLEENEKVFLGYSNHDSKQVITDLWIKLKMDENESFDTIKLNLIHDKTNILSESRFYVSIYQGNMPDDYSARSVPPAYNTLNNFLLGNIWNGVEGENTIIKLSSPKEEKGTYYINIHSNQAGLYAKSFSFESSLVSNNNVPTPVILKMARGAKSAQDPVYSIHWILNGGIESNPLPTQGTMDIINELYNNLNENVSKEYYTIKNKYLSGPDSWGIVRIEVEWELDNTNKDLIKLSLDGKTFYYIPNVSIQLPVNSKGQRVEYWTDEEMSPKYFSPHLKYNSNIFSDIINLYSIPMPAATIWPLFAQDENGEWQTAYNIYIKGDENQWQ